MKVGELKKLLALVEDDREVIVPAKAYVDGELVSTVGPISHVKIKNAAPGFDWEASMFILFPKYDLRYDLEKS